MNKKERFCDVLALQATKDRADNIVEWRHILTIIDFYLSVCDRVIIRADVRPDLQLLDVGKLDSLTQAEEMVQKLGL